MYNFNNKKLNFETILIEYISILGRLAKYRIKVERENITKN